MSDQFTEVSEQGLGGNLLESIKGVAVGGILFLLSFPVLWWNEGRTDLSQVAKKAQVIKADTIDKSGEGKLVSLTGELRSDEKIGDPQFLLPGAYVRLQRVVEMFAWVENKETKTEKKLGGGSRKETTYSYETEWTERPASSASFRYPEGHENPPLPVQGEVFTAKQGTIGAYRFHPGEAELPRGGDLKLTSDMVKVPLQGQAPAPAEDAPEKASPASDDGGDDEAAPPGDDEEPKAKKKRRHGRRAKVREAETVERPAPARRAAARPAAAPAGYQLVGDRYLFRGKGTMERPRVGDVRISFRVLQPGLKVTLFGQLQGDEVVAYVFNGDEKLFRALPGTHAEAVQTLAAEHKIITWILRLVGWLMMWFGLMMFFGPINAVLDIVPFLGSAGRFLIGIAMLPVSLLLSTVVIVISIIAHSPVLLVLTVAALGAGGFLLYRKRQARRA